MAAEAVSRLAIGSAQTEGSRAATAAYALTGERASFRPKPKGCEGRTERKEGGGEGGEIKRAREQDTAKRKAPREASARK